MFGVPALSATWAIQLAPSPLIVVWKLVRQTSSATTNEKLRKTNAISPIYAIES
jgi:hypothetical protein